MINFTPDEIRGAVHGRWRWPTRPVAMKGVSTDSRTAKPGDLFIALRGDRFDGHKFLPDAAAKGCIAAIVAQDAPLGQDVLERFGGGVIGVADTTLALGEVAMLVRKHLSATVIGVTGSNGKTTVKRMIDHILSRRLKGSGSPKSFNNAIGVPLTLFAVGAEDDYVVCEIGTNAPGEIAALTRIARPDVAVITSVSETHLEKLIDLEHVAAEKAAIMGGLNGSGVGIVWSDSEPLARALKAYTARLIRFGKSDSADLRLTGYQATEGGGRFEVNGRLWVNLSILGPHNAVNALAAMAVAQRFGFGQDEAAAALADYAGEEMRLQSLQAGTVTIINDAYNANPASMRAAGEAMASFPGRRHVLVAGDMLELGPRETEFHLSAGAALAHCKLDLVIGVGPRGRYVAQGAAQAGQESRAIDTVEQALVELPDMLRPGDVVLIKGSRGSAMERLIEPLRAKFDAKGV